MTERLLKRRKKKTPNNPTRHMQGTIQQVTLTFRPLWVQYFLSACLTQCHSMWHLDAITNSVLVSLIDRRTRDDKVVGSNPAAAIHERMFYVPDLKGPPGQLVIRPSVCLFVGNSVPLTYKVQYWMFGWSYSNHCKFIKGLLRLLWHHMPLGWGGMKNVGNWDFAKFLLFCRRGISVLQTFFSVPLPVSGIDCVRKIHLL